MIKSDKLVKKVTKSDKLVKKSNRLVKKKLQKVTT